jgi:cysteine desulfurase
MNKLFLEDFGNASSVHQFGAKARQYIATARKTIAERINAYPEEIIFTSGGSESDNFALRSILSGNNQGKKHLITTTIEHPAILRTAEQLEREGYDITYLTINNEGFVNLAQLEQAITDQTALVSIMAANNEIGTIQNIEGIGKICQSKGVPFHTDAVQAFTKVPLDVVKHNISLMSLTAHKIHGPKGIGCLYIRKDLHKVLKKYKLIYGGHQESDFRAGTENVPGIAGFGKATELATPNYIASMSALRDHLIRRIETEITEVKLNGPRGDKRLANNVNFSFKRIEGEGLLMHLDMHGIAVSTGSACSSQSLDPSHVLTSIGLSHEDAHGSIRLTLGRENTREEIDYAVDRLKEAVDKLRTFTSLQADMTQDAIDVVTQE